MTEETPYKKTEPSLAEQFHKRVGILVPGNIWDMDFAPLNITKESRENFLNISHIFNYLPIRLRMGLFYTDEEREKNRNIKLRER